MGALAVLTVSVFHAWWIAKVGHLHGDLLYFESIYHDALLPAHAFKDFQFTETIFAFPDFLLFCLVRPLCPTPAWAVVGYHFTFSVGLSLLLWTLWRRVGRQDAPEPKSTLQFFAALATFYFLTDSTAYFYGLVSSPEHHGAIALSELMCVWQLVDLRQGRTEFLWRWLLVDFICAVGFGFSDLLALPAVFLPVIGLVAFWAWDRTFARRAAGQVILIITLGLISGILIKYLAVALGGLTIDPSDTITLGWKEFVRSSQKFIGDLQTLAVQDWFFFGMATALLVGLSRGRTATVWQRTFAGLAILSLSFKLGAILVNGRWDGIFAIRYLQELYLFPLIQITIFDLPRWLNAARARLVLSVIALTSLGFLLWPPRTLGLTDKPETTLCLEAHAEELRSPYGLGDFWIAKLVTFSSTKGLVVNQVKRNFSRYYWMNSPVWYESDVHNQAITKYTYAVGFDAGSTAAARSIWGTPTSEFTCPFEGRTVRILVYPQGITPAPADRSRVR